MNLKTFSSCCSPYQVVIIHSPSKSARLYLLLLIWCIRVFDVCQSFRCVFICTMTFHMFKSFLGGVIANMYRISFGGDENVMELGSGDGCTAFVTILKTIELYTYLKE